MEVPVITVSDGGDWRRFEQDRDLIGDRPAYGLLLENTRGPVAGKWYYHVEHDRYRAVVTRARRGRRV